MARKAKILPDVEELKRMFYIDSSIPEGLRWKISKYCAKNDSSSGYKHHTGYYYVKCNYITCSNHRIIFSIYHNINLTSEQIVDHIDRCKENNNPNNLRIVTDIENNRNRTKRKKTSSRFRGVDFQKSTNKYRARIHINGTSVMIGSYSTELEAAKAYNDYIISHNLSHFNLNQI